MIPVSDVWEEIKKINGNCNADVSYRKLNDAVELLANKSDWDPLVGFIDISCDETFVTLPPEIETPIAISYGRWPAMPRGQLFRFHLNGPGDRNTCSPGRFWEDANDAVTYRELCEPRAVQVVACNSADVGQIVWFYGYDENRNPIRTEVEGEWFDGYPVTVALDYVPAPDAPLFSEITRVRKPVTIGSLNAWTVLDGALEEILAVYYHYTEEPRFRRLRIDRASELVRIHYRRRNEKLRTQTDLIPLHNRQAVVMMVRALKYYDDADFPNATAAEATAVRWLTEEQATRNPSISDPIQVSGMLINDDYEIN